MTRTAGLGPGQVEVLTSANVSTALKLSGAKLSADAGATVRGLRVAFADVALGFDPSLLVLSPSAPPETGPPPTAVAFARDRRLLAVGLPAHPGRALLSEGGGGGDGAGGHWGESVYVSYTGLSPSSVGMLAKAMAMSCGELRAGRKLPGASRAAAA